MESTIPIFPLKWLGVGHIIPSLNCIAIVWSIGPVRRSRPHPWEQGWRSGESACLPPMWPGFKSRRQRHMCVEFVVGSLLCSKRFSPGTPVFPCPQKPTFPNSTSTRSQVDKEPLCGCATCRSLFISLFYFFILL